MDDAATPAELLETRLLDSIQWIEGHAYFCCIFATALMETKFLLLISRSKEPDHMCQSHTLCEF